MKLLLHNRITARRQEHYESSSPCCPSDSTRKRPIYNKGVSFATLAFVVALSLSGCSQIEDDLSGCPASDASESSYPVSRIVLRITTSGDSSADDGNSTRASGPTGGEPSVYETGTEAEYKVETAIAFLYEDAGSNGINDSANDGAEVTPIVFESMASNEAGSGNIDHTYTSEEQNANLTGTYKTLVVANPPSDWLDTYKNATGLTLNDIRDLRVTTLQNESNDFIMSSSEEGDVTIGGGSSSGTTTIEATVQRVAARVDYMVNGNLSITDENDAYYGGSITIQGAALVNDLNSGSYLLKRVTSSIYDYDDGTTEYPASISFNDITYLGKEVATYADDDVEKNVISGNYVIDPWTVLKTGSIPSGLTYGTTYSGVASSSITYPETTYTQQDPEYWNKLASSIGTSIGSDWYRIGYTMENTTFAPYTSKMYSTGVVFKALFDPSTITATNTFVNSCYSGYEYKSGNTFFKYNNVLYATLEDLMCATLGTDLAKEFLTASDVSNTLTNNSITTWDDLATYIKDMSVDPLGYKDYLTGLCDAGTGNVNFSSITDYLSSTFGYSYDSTNGVKLDQNSYNTYSELLKYNVTTYENGICYYVWWIRHSNDNDDSENGIMEYSIVRNNVYKLQVISVSTLGGAIPTEGLLMTAKVEPWTLLSAEYVNM